MVDCAECGRNFNGAVLKACPACQAVHSLARALNERKRADDTEHRKASLAYLDLERVTTLQELPGYRTVRSRGLVFALQGASGLTAGGKGREAASRATRDFLEEARRMGANAVLGVHTAAFGAGGGITNILGGDAVGIVLVGTAAVVEALPESSI